MPRTVQKSLFSILLFILWTMSAHAQTEWTAWTTADGLPENEIRALAAGPGGGIWVGTELGAARFDGHSWKTYTTADGLADNHVTSIAFGPDGTVWFATARGVSRFDRNSWTTFIPLDEDSTRVLHFQAIAVAPDGMVYAGANWGLFRFDGAGWTQQGRGNITRIVFSPDGAGWAGGFYSLYHWNETGWSLTSEELFYQNPILPLLAMSDSTVWFSQLKSYTTMLEIQWRGIGATMYGGSARIDYPLDNTMPVYVTSAAIDTRGAVWLGTDRGLYRFDGVTWKTCTIADGLPSDVILALAIDASGAMWVGTDKGVARCTQTITAVEKREDSPKGIHILGNRPNPFNPSTTIEFSLPEPGTAKLAIYDITGRKVRGLRSAPLSAGKHTVVWDGRDDGGRPAASGIYFSRLEYGGRKVTAKLMLMR